MVDVDAENGEHITAWVYLYNRDATQLIEIKSCDYVQYLESVR